jgi:hypothetical protein
MLKLSLVIFFVFLAGSAFATTGLPSAIEVLGYDPIELKIFFTYDDGCCITPVICYFDLNKSSEKFPDYPEIYRDERNTGIDEKEFSETVKRIKKRLIKMQELPLKALSITKKVEKRESDSHEYMTEENPSSIPLWQISLKFKIFNLRAESILYATCNYKYDILKIFVVPVEEYALVFLSYTGLFSGECNKTHNLILLSPSIE